MPTIRTKSNDVLFPVETVRLVNPTPGEAREFLLELKREFDRESDFGRTLRRITKDAKAVLTAHPGMGTSTGSCDDRAPLIVHDAVDLLWSLPLFRKALRKNPEAGIRGYYLGLTHGRMMARCHEKPASAGVAQSISGQKGGRQRAENIAAQRDYDGIEREIREYMRKNPSLSRAAIIVRIAPAYKIRADALERALRRRKQSAKKR